MVSDTKRNGPANPYALGNEAPDDLDGRMFQLEGRAKMIGCALQALSHSALRSPDPDTLYAFGQLALEMAEEIEAVRNAYIPLCGENAQFEHKAERP